MRLVFATPSQLSVWIDSKVFENRYDCYVTQEKEIILIPIRSTQPLLIAYLKVSNDEELKSVEEKLRSRRIALFDIKCIDWAADRPVGIKIPQDD